MTTLVISPYAPYRDGIAVYTVQEVRARRQAGEDLEVLSPTPSAAHHHAPLGGPYGWGKLQARLKDFDAIEVQLYPELLHGACHNPVERVAAWTALEAVCRRLPTELRVHELDYGPARNNPLERAAALRAFRAADRVVVHTAAERDALCSTYGVSAASVSLFDHGQYFASNITSDRAEARRELGLDPDAHLFLAIGFLQSHKGFDRAVRAFARGGFNDPEHGVAELHVVGSVRLDVPELVAYAQRLRQQISQVDGASFHERFVSDAEFDLWVIASDTVVLPYREIFSSGVLERANLLERAVIASEVGGLAGQLRPGSVQFGDDDQLLDAMLARVGKPAGSAASSDLAIEPVPAAVEAYVRASLGTDDDPKGLGMGEPLTLPPPYSHRPGIGRFKQAVRVLTGWQLHPIVDRINQLESVLDNRLRHESDGE